MIVQKPLLKGLLFCGVLSSLIRIATDIISAMLYPSYNYLNQSMSQLAAVGSPTRLFQVILLSIYCFLMIAFGIGVWKSAGKKHSLSIVGILLIIFGLIGLAQQLIPSWSMQLNGEATANNTHIIVTIINILLILFFIGFGASVYGKRFRIFSVMMVLALLFFGALAGQMASKAVQFSAPWMGLMERLSYYSYLIWILVFGTILLYTREYANLNKHNQ